MSRIYVLLSLFLLPALLVPAHADARKNRKEKPPKALLVELLTHGPQLKHLTAKKPERVAEFQKDVAGVMKVTINDFSQNFDYVPVYYFIDTNASLIRQGKFDGVLLDEHMRPVQQNVLKEGDTNFFIAVYGNVVPQPMVEKAAYSDNNHTGALNESFGDDPTALRKTLLVMDHDFVLLQVPRPRTYKHFIALSRSKHPDLFYNSRLYEIDYLPMAASYNVTLEKYYRQPRRRYE